MSGPCRPLRHSRPATKRSPLPGTLPLAHYTAAHPLPSASPTFPCPRHFSHRREREEEQLRDIHSFPTYTRVVHLATHSPRRPYLALSSLSLPAKRIITAKKIERKEERNSKRQSHRYTSATHSSPSTSLIFPCPVSLQYVCQDNNRC